MAIEFVRVEETARFHSPLEGMALVERVIERRRDPLLGHWAIGSPGLAGKKAVFFGATDEALMERLAEQSREKCFFCPERVAAATPRYPDDCLPGGCLEQGECFLFPNLFPLGAIHAVVVLGRAHFLQLDEFTPGLLADGLSLAVRCARAARAHAPEAVWYTVNANYLFPAGASVFHPHLQVLGGPRPPTATQRLVEACRAFAGREGQDYFAALLAAERSGERWVGNSGPACFLTSFAPQGTNEVLGVVPGRRLLTELTAEDLAGLAAGLSRVLGGYRDLGFSTFNFTVFSDRLDAPEPAFPVFVRVVARQNVYENYRADDYFVQKLLGEELMVVPPEQVAESLRAGWADV